MALMALAWVAPRPSAAAETDFRPLRLVPVSPEALGLAWIKAHFPDASFSVPNGYWAGVDRSPAGELRVVVVSGVSTCLGDTHEQKCPMVVFRPAEHGRETVAYTGLVCADPDEIAIRADHLEIKTCGVVHALR